MHEAHGSAHRSRWRQKGGSLLVARMVFLVFLASAALSFAQEARIFYERDWDPNIYSINPDGTDRKVVTQGTWPVLSPDGQFLVLRGDDGIVRVLTSDGTPYASLGKGSGAILAWSPDGQQLAFWRSGGICVANKDGSAERSTGTGQGAFRVYWSPTEPYVLAYSAARGMDASDTYLYNIATGELRRIREYVHIPHLQYPFSPDGTRLFVSDDCGGGSCVRILDLASGALTSAVVDGQQAGMFDPAWSPDGTRIAFSVDAGRGGLFVADADGKGAVQLVPGSPEAAPQGAVWSASGERIAFYLANIAGEHRSQLCVVRADGTGLTRLTEGTRPMWALRPSGSLQGVSVVQDASWGAVKHRRGR